MIWETYQNAYKNATNEIRELLDSEIIPICVKKSLEKRDLTTLRRVTTVEVAGYICNAQTIDDTVKNLMQAGIQDALQFLAEVQTCIKQPVTPTSVIIQQISQNLAAEISETEKELASLQVVRTMPHDMATIRPGSDVVYQSSQADILAAPAPLAAPQPPQPPRWETDTKQ